MSKSYRIDYRCRVISNRLDFFMIDIVSNRLSKAYPHRADDLDLDHLDLNCHYEMLCRICVVQIQPRKYRVYDADYTASARQHELH